MRKLLDFPGSFDRNFERDAAGGLEGSSAFISSCAELQGSIASLNKALTAFQASADNLISGNDRLKLRARKSEIQNQIELVRRLLAKTYPLNRNDG